MMKKALALLMALALTAACFTACSRKGNVTVTTAAPAATAAVSEVQVDISGFKLSYSKSDSLSPFASSTLNNQVLQTLVFESLFIMDEGWEATPMLAEGFEYTDNETLKVTLRQGVTFSNGDALTAENVVYSFHQAKDSPHWSASLSAFSSASEEDKHTVIFHLSRPNPQAHKLLTFAIAKKNTDKNGYPVGSGRYRFGEGDGLVYLEVNKKYREEFKPHFTKILLVNITAEESIENAVNIGNISFTFRDMSRGSKNKMQCQKKPVALNNLVYLGINSDSGITKNERIRQAISLAADRSTLVKSAYRGYAKPALSVFNPASAMGKQATLFGEAADPDAARQAISQSGIDAKDLKLDILTSTGEGKSDAAQLLKQQLEAVGFKVSINREKPSDYQKKVKAKSFNIYIGETKLTNDMSLNSFFDAGGATGAGINPADSKSAAAYQGYLTGENEIGKFLLDFSQELPFIPLLYRQGMICYSHSMHGDMQGYTDNCFSNIEDWYFN